MHVVLVSPEIAPNTGNIIRLCANTGATLHLVEPLGFRMDGADLRRAGLDYRELVDVTVHPDLASLRSQFDRRWFAFTSGALRRYTDVEYRTDDVVVFGSERAGLDAATLETFPPDRQLRIPMRPQNRSLNLANAVAVVVYEGWRQRGFIGADASPAAGHGVTSERPGDPPFDR